MKEYWIYGRLQVCSFLFLFIFAPFCYGQDKTSKVPSEPKDSSSESKTITAEQIKIYGSPSDPFLHGQVSQYIRRMFQDKNGNLWFGTNGDGVCRYDGKSLTYFTTAEGFSGHAVRGISEDENGNLWFATDGGVSVYDGSRANHPCNKNSCDHDLRIEQAAAEHYHELAKSFTNYTVKDGLMANETWCILKDRAGNFWIGTEGGVSRYDAVLKIFTSFPIPAADLTHFPHAYPAPKLVNCIFEDKTGNLWFGTNGNGVYRYDYNGTSLTNISEKEGLCNNFVQCIFEDKTGVFWFGTRFGGLSRYDGKTFTRFTMNEGLCGDFVWTMVEDKNVPAAEVAFWIGTAGGGACRYDGKSFTNYTEKEGLTNKYVQSILEDRSVLPGEVGIWFGASGGLFRFDGKSFTNIKKSGPWPF